MREVETKLLVESHPLGACASGGSIMERKVFVGSSTEGLGTAQQILDLLEKEPDIKCVLWNEVFEPGSLTFEALEDMLTECCAAVLVATPDTDAVVRGIPEKLPSQNVMLEFGLIAGRLGRHNIALCAYGDTKLPTDVAGLTVIRMRTKGDAPGPSQEILAQGEVAQLHRWCSRLLPTTERLPRTEIVHGYTGVWDFEMQFKTWRGVAITGLSYSQVNGQFFLWISADGTWGQGDGIGRLAFKLYRTCDTCREGLSVRPDGSLDDPKPFSGEFHVSHLFQNVECLQNGGLKISSRTHSVQRIMISGKPWPPFDGLYGPPEPWLFEWTLNCPDAPRVLEGRFETSSGGGTEGDVKAIKRHS